jgi:hypothetical protein
VTGLTTSPPSTPNPRHIDAETLLLFAIEELDVHISELIGTGSFSISAIFHDWVADSLTTKIELRLLAEQESSRFNDDLRQDDARTVVRHWVRQWICMEIKQHFGLYVQFCPCTNSFIAHQMTGTTTAGSSDKLWPSALEGLDT